MDSILVWDISSPLRPRQLASIATGHERPVLPQPIGGIDGSTHEALDILNYGDRTLLAASIWTIEGSGRSEAGPVVFWDVTDGEKTRELTRVRVYSGELAAHRAAHLIYSATDRSGYENAIDIIDARDPDNIRVAAQWTWPPRTEDGMVLSPSWCKDLNLDQVRARLYCTTGSQTLVIDVSTPLQPRVVHAVSHPDLRYPGSAFPILNGKVLVVLAGLPGPQLAVDGAYAADSGLNDAWFFNLDQKPPTLLGRASLASKYGAPQFGTEIGEGTGMLAITWGGYLVLVDASDPTSPRMLGGTTGTEKVSINDVAYYRGLAFASGNNGLISSSNQEGLLVIAPQ